MAETILANRSNTVNDKKSRMQSISLQNL